MSVPLERYRFTVGEYHQLGEAGILHEDDRVELLEGEIGDDAADRSAARGLRESADPQAGSALWGGSLP